MLVASPQSPRAERIAIQIATCADDFLGAVLHDWIQVDPAGDARAPASPALQRWVRDTLHTVTGLAAGGYPAQMEMRESAFN
jgi:flagellar biosynthesis protein FlhG